MGINFYKRSEKLIVKALRIIKWVQVHLEQMKNMF
jgi:hypothetical protein